MWNTALFFALISAVTVEGQEKAVYKVLPNPSACLEPKESGPCDAYIPRYFFNSTSRRCEQFIYGGCGGNANNFFTLSDCLTACQNNVCLKPLKVGPCKAAIDRYYFDEVSRQCKLFSRGGCTANGNNFRTLVNCQRICEGKNCYHEGQWYADGSRVPSSSPCEHCRCNKGQVACFIQDCARPQCSNPTVPPGKCCPVCNGPDTGKSCYHEGQWYADGSRVPSSGPCEHCQCYQGQVSCFIQDCARPQCSNPTVPPGQCCPVCNGPDTELA